MLPQRTHCPGHGTVALTRAVCGNGTTRDGGEMYPASTAAAPKRYTLQGAWCANTSHRPRRMATADQLPPNRHRPGGLPVPIRVSSLTPWRRRTWRLSDLRAGHREAAQRRAHLDPPVVGAVIHPDRRGDRSIRSSRLSGRWRTIHLRGAVAVLAIRPGGRHQPPPRVLDQSDRQLTARRLSLASASIPHVLSSKLVA